MLQLRLPKQQLQQPTIAKVANHFDVTSTSRDSVSTAESEDGVHPLAPNHLACNQVSPSAEEKGSLQSLYHGQDFSHMLIEPTYINVQLEDEDEKGIEVSSLRILTLHVIVLVYACVHACMHVCMYL